MKKKMLLTFSLTFSLTILTVVGLLVLNGCSNDPTPPPNTVFRLEGKAVTIDGQIKPEAKITVDEAKLILRAAIDEVEGVE